MPDPVVKVVKTEMVTSIRLLNEKLLLISLAIGSCSSSMRLARCVRFVHKNRCRIFHLQLLITDRQIPPKNSPTNILGKKKKKQVAAAVGER